MTVTLIIPTYNEEKRICHFLNELLAYKKNSEDNVEIIVVDNASIDKTPEILKSYELGIRIIIHERNKGKGASIKTGILAANGDFIVFMDADGSTGINQLPKMLAALEKSPVVVGSRIEKESVITYPSPLIRRIGGKILNITVNLLFPLNFYDCFCGFKGMRAKEGKELANEMISTCWIFDVELLALVKKKGFGFMVIPVEWHYEKDSKIRLWTSVEMLINLLKLRINLRQSRISDKKEVIKND